MYEQQLAADTTHIPSEYLRSRGLSMEVARRYRFGYVAEPLDGHGWLKGRLVIPYITQAGVVNVKYRCLENHDCKVECKGRKYLFEPGSQATLFNVNSLLTKSNAIVLTEGELDAVAVEALAGLPAVGYPGVEMWGPNRYWRYCFDGFGTVFILADGDEAGRTAAEKILADLPTGVIVSMPEGHDANSFILEYGIDAFKEKLK